MFSFPSFSSINLLVESPGIGTLTLIGIFFRNVRHFIAITDHQVATRTLGPSRVFIYKQSPKLMVLVDAFRMKYVVNAK